MNPHMLPMQMHPSLLQSGAAASPLRPPTFPPEICVLPQPMTAKTSIDPCGLTRPRNGFRPSFQQRKIEPNLPMKQKEAGSEDDVAMGKQNHSANNQSLHVDCHVMSPNSNWKSQPITPSPRSFSALRDGSSSWGVPGIRSNNNRFASSHDFGSDGKRIGYDGTTQTPSLQLLKPTASSLGHRVQKSGNSQAQLSSPASFQSSRLDFPRMDINSNDAANPNRPGFGRNSESWEPSPKITFDTSILDPFGKLNDSSHNSLDEDEFMANTTQNSSELMLDLEFDVENSGEEEANEHHKHHAHGNETPPGSFGVPRTAMQRCSSWSPGSKTLQQHYRYNKRVDNTQRLRSHVMDPVASQLLRACAGHEEEQEEKRGQDSFLLSSYVFDQISKVAGAASEDDAAMCRSPKPSLESGNFSVSASMPDLLSPIPNELKRGRGDKSTPMIAEETPVEYPMSPVPLFREVSDSLLDVKTEDDIKCLPRPVPRKFSMPAIAGSPYRRSSLPRHL